MCRCPTRTWRTRPATGPDRRADPGFTDARRKAVAFSVSGCRFPPIAVPQARLPDIVLGDRRLKRFRKAAKSECCAAATGCLGVAQYWPLSLHLTSCGVYIPRRSWRQTPAPPTLVSFGITRGRTHEE